MAVATWIVLWLLVDLSFQQGTRLLPPQNVTLSSENFYSFLTWNPAPDGTGNTQYEVERTSGYVGASLLTPSPFIPGDGEPIDSNCCRLPRTIILHDDWPCCPRLMHNGVQYLPEDSHRSFLEWIQVAPCGENNLKHIQRCQLHLSELTNGLHNFYQARVRAKHGPHLSEWAISKGLQLYRDSVIGPLDLFLSVADQDLTISVFLPQTPLNDSIRRDIVSVLKVRIVAKEEGDDNTMEILTIKLSTMNHTFESMKPNANYCITATVKDQPAKEAVKCIKMPRKSANDDWTAFFIALIILFGFILLGLFGGTFLKHYLFPSSSGMVFPKSLAFVNATASTLRLVLEQDDGSVTSLSMLEVLPSDSNVMAEQEGSQVQMDAGECSTWVYRANGFHPDSTDNADCSLFPVAIADSLSSIELLGNGYRTQWAYRTSQELLGSSEHPPHVRVGCPLYGLGTVSWELTSKIKNKNRQRRCPFLCRTDIPLGSVKLQSELDTGRTYVTVEDGDAYAEPPLPPASESQAHPGQSHSSKDRKLHDRSNLEARDRNSIRSSGYECRPPILPCEFEFHGH